MSFESLSLRLLALSRESCTAHVHATAHWQWARRMGKGESSALVLPLTVTGLAVVGTLLVFWWWSKRSAGRGSRGTRFKRENGQPVRRSTR